MAGWKLKAGELNDQKMDDDRYWSLFNFVFSDSSMKRNTYKFGLVKAILDNLFNGTETENGVYISYYDLFAKFAENYWNLVVKYNLRQMRKDKRSELSRLEVILMDTIHDNCVLEKLEFESIEAEQKKQIIKKVMTECKRCVIGALYEDFEGALYGFDLADEGLYLSYKGYEFMLRHKMELEKLNYYSWAKFLEKINEDSVLVKVIDKLELSTPKRNNLSVYQSVMEREFGECNCFYCGKKLKRLSVHVDHVIPWSFVKDDKIWNLVLSCAQCNEKKHNRIPVKDYILQLEKRNHEVQNVDNAIVQRDFSMYSDRLIERMAAYAKRSGIKEYSV